MKILYCFFGIPSTNYGGGICSAITQHCLTKAAEVDYIGSELSENYLKENQILFNSIISLHGKQSKIKRLLELVKYDAFTQYYNEWYDTINKINPKDYDCVFLEYTIYPFVVKWANNNGIPIIIRAHNVETDYTKAVYNTNKNLKNYITYLITKKLEKKCLKYKSLLIPITEYDKNQFIKYYRSKSCFVIPIGLPHNQLPNVYKTNRPKITMIGSLWFGPNADGAEWFLRNVWKNVSNTICKDYDFILAGSNPRKEIQELAKELPNVYIYANPETVTQFYQQTDIFVAPIFYGSGMKIKVAEAMSYGLHIIVSNHAFIGYESADELIYKANTAEEFINCLKTICSMNNVEKEIEKKAIFDCYNKNYSLIASEKKYSEMLNIFLKKN